ncbi:MAG: phytoene desaturase family protein, partial [Solirubrobacteraceae bacterium]
WMGALRDVASAAFPYLQGHPTRVHPRTIARIVRRLARHRKSLLPGARALLSAPSEVLAGFEREEVRAFLAMNVATGSFRPIDEPANMSAMVYFAMLHLYRLHRPIGGSGAYCEALARAVRSWGGEIRTSSPVERIAIHNGKAVGVVLRSGETILASQVISATDPVSLVTKLLADADVPPITRTEVDRLQVNANNVAHFKADLAVSRRPRFVKPGIQEEHFGGGMSFAPSQAHAHRTLTEIINGGLSDEPPFFYIAVPSVLDRSLVPAGSDGDSIFVWVGAVPHEFADGRTWETEKQPFFDKVIDHLERFIPDLRSTIVGQQVTSPADMNVEWVHKGSARGVDVVPSQMGPWRPTPSLAGYRTPFGGLWHTGHGAHPMSGTSGWPGRIAARTVLKALD